MLPWYNHDAGTIGRSNSAMRRLRIIGAASILLATTAACASGPVVRSAAFATAANEIPGPAEPRLAGYYALPLAYYSLTIERDKDGVLNAAIAEAPLYLPDRSRTYAVRYLTGGWSADQITVETDGLGLLKSVAPKSTDATGAIILKAIELASTVGQAAVARERSLLGLRRQPPCGAAGPFKRQYWINPAELEAAQIAQIKRETCFAVSSTPIGGVAAAADPTARVQGGAVDGILYRPAVPFRVVAADAERGVSREFLVLAPDAAVTLVARLDRKAITGLNTTLTFANGMLTKFESTDPNQAVAALQIPIDALKAIVAIPGELLSVKVKQAQDETGYLVAQKALLDARLALEQALAAQTAAAAAKD